VPNDRILTLYVAHRQKLVTYANGIVGDVGRAEDVVQEAYLRFRTAASGRLLDEPVGYLYRIVRNLALDARRRLTLENRHVEGDVERIGAALAEDRPSPEAELIARQELERVIAAMAALPERTRIALEMHRFGGCTLKEIAAHLGISVSMAQVLVAEGVRQCQRSL
jgi:RNA polymerase sigma-70 factor (ECF subfamily)